MNAHHDDLQQQFHTLMDRRNEVKQTMDRIADTNHQSVENSYHADINRWEQNMIEQIQRLASTVRTNANELFKGYIAEIGKVFEQLSTDMEQQQKENIFVEMNIERVEHQLNQLHKQIQDVHKKIRIDHSMSKHIEWARLIRIVQDGVINKLPMETPDQACGVAEDWFSSIMNGGHQYNEKPKLTSSGTTESKAPLVDKTMVCRTPRSDRADRKYPFQSSGIQSTQNLDAVDRVSNLDATHRSKEAKKPSSTDDVAGQNGSRPRSSTWDFVRCHTCNFDNFTDNQASESCIICQSPLISSRVPIWTNADGNISSEWILDQHKDLH